MSLIKKMVLYNDYNNFLTQYKFIDYKSYLKLSGRSMRFSPFIFFTNKSIIMTFMKNKFRLKSSQLNNLSVHLKYAKTTWFITYTFFPPKDKITQI